MNNVKVSVIIPVYKVEALVERCAESLFNQTLKSVEYIFVDDASPDKSISLIKKCLEKHPERSNHVTFLTHERNQGLAAARNTGLAKACGEYIFHCDSDDYIESDALEKLFKATNNSECDIVWCDWYLSFEKTERYMKQPRFDDALSAIKAMVCGTMKYNVWNKLVRRKLYTENDISFPAGNDMGEDMTMIKLMSCANKVNYVPEAFYHYRKVNSGSFTNTKSNRVTLNAQLLNNVDSVVSFLSARYGSELQDYIHFFRLNVKYPLLISPSIASYKEWELLYPESDKYIRQNNNISRRAKMLQIWAHKKRYRILQLHYYLIYKLVYGVIFR